MSEQTTIRINLDTRDKLKAFGSTGQSMDGIINDLLEIAEKAGTIPAPETGPNTGFNDELTRLNDKYTNVVKSIHELNERLDSLIPGIEHQRDETGHALEMVFSIQKRLEALEAHPVTIPAHTPDDKPEENTRGDERDKATNKKERDATMAISIMQFRADRKLKNTELKNMGFEGDISNLPMIKNGGKGFSDKAYQKNLEILRTQGIVIEKSSSEAL